MCVSGGGGGGGGRNVCLSFCSWVLVCFIRSNTDSLKTDFLYKSNICNRVLN